jgi:hypothetical protein
MTKENELPQTPDGAEPFDYSSTFEEAEGQISRPGILKGAVGFGRDLKRAVSHSRKTLLDGEEGHRVIEVIANRDEQDEPLSGPADDAAILRRFGIEEADWTSPFAPKGDHPLGGR